MRILVVGGTRFIGPYVVRQLVAHAHDVTVYHRGDHEGDLPASVRHVHDPHAGRPVLRYPDALRNAAPDVVVHMLLIGEGDAREAVAAWRDRARRLVAISSGDVYRAYGRFTGLEPGPVEPCPLDEDAPLRSVLYPYRHEARSPDDWRYAYEKILAEREVLSDASLEGVVLRLPKVYGPGDNADLATVYSARRHVNWRWTHGYVENVAAAIVLAALHPAAGGRVYNIGERDTPTIAERLRDLPMDAAGSRVEHPGDYRQDIAYDTRRIRDELGFEEIVPYREGLRRTLATAGR